MPVGAAHRDVLAVVVVHDLTGQLVGTDDAAHRDPAATARAVEDPLDLRVEDRVDDLDAAARVPLATYLARQVVAAVVEPRVHADPDHRAARDRPRVRLAGRVLRGLRRRPSSSPVRDASRAASFGGTGIPVCGVAWQLIRRSTRTIGSRRGSAIGCGNAQYTASSARNFQIGCSGTAVDLHLVEQHSQAHVRLLGRRRVSMWFHWPLAAFFVRLAEPTMLTHLACPTWLNRKIFECRVPARPRQDRRHVRAKLHLSRRHPVAGACGGRRAPAGACRRGGARRSPSRLTSSCTLTPRRCALISALVILASA